VKIEYLCDHIQFADTVASWLYDAFISGIRDDLSRAYVLSSVKNCHKLEFPIRLIALLDGNCVGTVSIVSNDLKCREYTPWLAAFYVDKGFRNQKIGEQLIDCVKSIVTQLGYKEVYLRTEHTSAYYRKLGWRFIETCADRFNLKPDVFVFHLP